jgi:hypothetical protein
MTAQASIELLTAEEQAELAALAIRDGDRNIQTCAARLVRRAIRQERDRISKSAQPKAGPRPQHVDAVA